MLELRPFTLLFLFVSLLSGCGDKNRKTKSSQNDSLTVPTAQIPVLSPLGAGDIHLTNEDFGTTIDLIGEPLKIKENTNPEMPALAISTLFR